MTERVCPCLSCLSVRSTNDFNKTTMLFNIYIMYKQKLALQSYFYLPILSQDCLISPSVTTFGFFKVFSAKSAWVRLKYFQILTGHDIYLNNTTICSQIIYYVF